jgi:tetratricopeptide (TPR) repeat protein
VRVCLAALPALAFAAAALLTLSSCAARSGRAVEARLAEDDILTAQAGSEVARGSYPGFKKAVELYGRLYAKKSLRPRVAGRYLEACLLLALREKSLGLRGAASIDRARALLDENPSLAGMEPYYLAVASIPPRTKGVIQDIETRFWDFELAKKLTAALEELSGRASRQAFAALVVLARNCHFKDQAAPQDLQALYPDSLLIQYQAAVCSGDEQGFKDLLARHPHLVEVRYFLGEAALARGALLEAENHFLEALTVLPESPQVPLLLGGIYFATEEFEKSVAFYDRALEVEPDYRDALLGKAVSLGYLGRHREALAPLARIMELGYWLIGESHYWTAWNLHELGENDEAVRNIEEAKKRLPTDSEVFSLSGRLAYEAGDDGKADRDFNESLVYNPANSASLFGLGNVRARQGRFAEAAGFYERAGDVFSRTAAALEARLAEVRGSALEPGRKEALARRKEAQLEKARLSAATAYYDAAAMLVNHGERGQKSLALAEKAAAHPALKDKAAELLRAVEKK